MYVLIKIMDDTKLYYIMKYGYQTEFNEIMKKYKKTNKFKEVSLLSELIQILDKRLIEQSTEFIDYSKFDTTILKKYFDLKNTIILDV